MRWLLLPSLLLLACAGAPPPAGRAQTPQRSEAQPPSLEDPEAEVRPPTRPRPELRRLLPILPDSVLWYRLERGGEQAGRVAFFLARDGKSGPYLESVGLNPRGQPALRLWRSHDAVWLSSSGVAEGGAYRVWVPEPMWDQGRGRRAGLDQVGKRKAVRLERVGHGVIVRHWLAEGVGLVCLEVEDHGQVAWRLELDEVVPRGPAAGYPRATPAQLWSSVEQAVRRLDVGTLQALKTPGLRRRTQRPSSVALRDVRPDGGSPLRVGPGAERVRQAVAEHLALDVRANGEWSIDGDHARQRVRLRVRGEEAVGWLVLERDEGGWRWDDVVVGG